MKIVAFLVSSSLVLSAVQAGSPDELNQLVAPIALYPDALVAQIVAGAGFPTEIVEAERWMKRHAELKGPALAQAVDQQPWDPSVKALTQFPSVLAMMDTNLSWTSSLGDADVNGTQSVLDAVQVMRRRAQQAGNLKSTAQEAITDQAHTIAIEPASPDVVYVPEYDPWTVYGAPVTLYQDWIDVPGAFYYGPGIYFGLGIGIGLFGGFGWGWHHWGTDWHGRGLTYDHHGYHAGIGHSGAPHGGFGASEPRGTRSGGAFRGVNRGGITNAYSSRGRTSLHVAGGGGFHGGAGGFHAGGGGFNGRGGGHR